MALSKHPRPVIENDSDSDFEIPMQNKCFCEFSDQELSDLTEDLDPANTVKSDIKCECILTAYLQQTGKSVNYWEYSLQELDKMLGKFWFAAHPQKGGEHYSVSSLKHIRYALKHLLMKKKKIQISQIAGIYSVMLVMN